MSDQVLATRELILAWIDSSKKKKDFREIILTEPDLFQCPKTDRCIMDCYHKKLHIYEEKYCNGLDSHCGVKCVHELISDCTFFDEDFNID